MPSLYSKINLSESLNGNGIVINSTGVSGNIIHTTDASSLKTDEVWLYGCNPLQQDILLKLNIGSTGSSGVVFNGVLEAYAGNVLLIPAFLMKGNGSSGLSIEGSISPSGSVNIYGYVNRITES